MCFCLGGEVYADVIKHLRMRPSWTRQALHPMASPPRGEGWGACGGRSRGGGRQSPAKGRLEPQELREAGTTLPGSLWRERPQGTDTEDTPSQWSLTSASFTAPHPKGQGAWPRPAGGSGGWLADVTGKCLLSPAALLEWGTVGREPLKGENPLSSLPGGASSDLFAPLILSGLCSRRDSSSHHTAPWEPRAPRLSISLPLSLCLSLCLSPALPGLGGLDRQGAGGSVIRAGDGLPQTDLPRTRAGVPASRGPG